ncbi:mucin-2-like, partial [Lucilia sericata]|uniref:mucin-2-like n=1 Tax=Lucilia sericata TaxID=13632 RepID=UPI0018A84BBC
HKKIEQHSPAPSTASSNTSLSCLSTPSPPKTTATKVVSQKTSLGIQQVSVTVSMQVENVTTATTPTTPEKENAGILTTSTTSGGIQTTTSSASSVKKERKITSYFTVVGQKADV